MTTQILTPGANSAAGWDQTIYAFLTEKERRSGSMRTEQEPEAFLDKSPYHLSVPIRLALVTLIKQHNRHAHSFGSYQRKALLMDSFTERFRGSC